MTNHLDEVMSLKKDSKCHLTRNTCHFALSHPKSPPLFPRNFAPTLSTYCKRQESCFTLDLLQIISFLNPNRIYLQRVSNVHRWKLRLQRQGLRQPKSCLPSTSVQRMPRKLRLQWQGLQLQRALLMLFVCRRHISCKSLFFVCLNKQQGSLRFPVSYHKQKLKTNLDSHIYLSYAYIVIAFPFSKTIGFEFEFEILYLKGLST